MKHIFYVFTFAAIAWEYYCIKNPLKVSVFIKTLKEKLKDKEVPFKDKIEALSDNEQSLIFLMLGYLAWTLVGILTSQWILFLALLIMGRIPKNNIYLKFADSVISFLILFFILINTYHLHINVFEWIKSFAI